MRSSIISSVDSQYVHMLIHSYKATEGATLLEMIKMLSNLSYWVGRRVWLFSRHVDAFSSHGQVVHSATIFLAQAIPSITSEAIEDDYPGFENSIESCSRPEAR